MDDRPAPLTPPDCDLRTFDWFPFFHKRLLKSSFWSRASDQAARISVDFWSRAYEQVPAASLPDDNYLLAEWAGFGRRNLDGWLAVKSEVMEPWVMCSDGRWYHPVLSEIACKAWVERRLHLWKRECERVRKENARRLKSDMFPLELPPKPSDDPFIRADVYDVSVENRPSLDGHSTLSGGQFNLSCGNARISDDDPPDKMEQSCGKTEVDAGFPTENALRERGREIGIESLSLRSRDACASATASPPEATGRPAKPPASRKHPFPPDAFERWYAGYPHKVGRAAAEKAFAQVKARDAVDFDDLCAAVERYKRDKPVDRPWCNPATWLNQGRWADQPALSNSSSSSPSTSNDVERFDLGGNVVPASTIRVIWGSGRWPGDWGPKPGQSGCRITEAKIAEIMERVA